MFYSYEVSLSTFMIGAMLSIMNIRILWKYGVCIDYGKMVFSCYYDAILGDTFVGKLQM
jgi:hypothetical protein